MKYPLVKTASAGSGKTYTLTEIVYKKIRDKEVRPEEIIATTFTVKAANEIKSRVREKLIKEGRIQDANRINAALIGTLNSIALKLVQRFALQLGISPTVETLAEEEQDVLIREIIGSMVPDKFIEVAHKLNQIESFFSKKILWVTHIEKIISNAKVNNISKEDFAAFAEEAKTELWSILPNSGNLKMESLIPALTEKLGHLLDSLDYQTLSKANKATYQSFSEIKNLLKNNDYQYDNFVALQNSSFPKKCKVELVEEELIALASQVTQTDTFKNDMDYFLQTSFEIAREVMDEYDDIKAQKGLLDFADQEALFHSLLIDYPAIPEILREDYKLIIWDEFQDSSPLQASIFFKLTQHIQHSYCLLDNKQSIYSFRNASPELIKGVIDQVPNKNKTQLPNSYRSTGHLVNFSNAVFSEVFIDMKQHEIVLNTANANETKRDVNKESANQKQINVWRFEKSDKAPTVQDYNKALINRIITFVEEENEVFDKGLEQYRTLGYGDIMILVRANKTADDLADLLVTANIPVASSGIGLCDEPEIIYLSAVLKLLVYANDTLAKAEIMLYSVYNGDQEKMIEDRLNYDKVWEWGADLEIWELLKTIKGESYTLSLSKTIKLIFEELNLASLFASWGNLSQRMANFEALIKHTKTYEDKCHSLNQGSSILGLLGFLNDLSDNDKDEKGAYLGSAVKIMTYHSSKGLESNVLILWDLHKEMKARYYGVDSYNEEKIDLSNLLSNRKIRFRINPFNAKRKDIAGWSEHIDNSPQMQSATSATLNEERRLLYVGITRARDYLIWGMTNLANKSKEYIQEMISPRLDFKDANDGLNTSLFNYNGNQIPVRFETHPIEKGLGLDCLEEKHTHLYYPKNSGRENFEALNIKPSDALSETGNIIEVVNIHEKISIDDKGISDSERGDFFHSIFAAIDDQTKREIALIKIKDTVDVFNLNKKVNESDIYDTIIDFYKHIYDSYDIVNIHRELAVRGINDKGQLTSGFIDFLIELKDGLILIDFKSFHTPEWNEELYHKKALSYNGQLDVYKSIIEKSFFKSVKEKQIYFCVMGKVVYMD